MRCGWLMHKANIFDAIPANLPEELSRTLIAGRNLRVERIVSRGHASPDGFWYDQDEQEWVLLLAGAARLEIKGEGEIALSPGDYLLLPAHCRHRVNWTDPETETIWLALFIAIDAQ